MRKIFGVAVLTFILLFSGFSFGQNDNDGLGLKLATQTKLMLADGKHKLSVGDVNGAMVVFKEVLSLNSNDAEASYKVGECYMNRKKYNLALEYFDKAKALNVKEKEIDFLYGKAFHRLGKLEKALEHYNSFLLNLGPKAEKDYEIKRYISQVELAEKMIENPVKVKINNLGQNINGTYTDYGPVLSSDMKTMLYSSRRPGDDKGWKDKNGDFGFFEDIYVSNWDSVKNQWGESQKFPGKVNTDFYDAALCFSNDDKILYIYRNIPDVTQSGDIYFSKLSKKGKWGTPKSVGTKNINTSFFEGSCSLTEDGKTMYYVSERKGSLGRIDIFVVKKEGKEWGEPVNLGDVINTRYDENTVYVTPDGNNLYFSSNGHNTMGGYDIFMSTREGDTWSKPVNLGYPINTVGDEAHFFIASDGNAYYDTEHIGNTIGVRDIYQIDLSEYELPELAN